MDDAVVVVFRADSTLGVNQNRVFNLWCKIGQLLSNKRGDLCLCQPADVDDVNRFHAAD